MKKTIILLCFLLIISSLSCFLIFGFTPVHCISKVTQTYRNGSVVTVDVDCDRSGRALKCRKEWENSFWEDSFTYDDSGNVLTKTAFNSMSDQPRVTTYQYDSHGNLISQNNDPNTFNDYTYNENGIMIKKRSFSSGKLSRTWIYDGNGNLIEDSSLTNTNNHFLYSYNEQNQLTASHQVVNGQTVLLSTHTYGENGKMLQSIHYRYDTLSDAHYLYSIVTYTYDTQGNLVKEHQKKDFSYAETTWTYDEAGRKLTEDHFPRNEHKEWTYDQNGNLTRLLYNDVEHTWKYDRYNNLIGHTYSNNGLISSVEISYTTVYLFGRTAGRVQALQNKVLEHLRILDYFLAPELP